MSSFLFCFSKKKDFLCFTILIYRYNRSADLRFARVIGLLVKRGVNVLIGVKTTRSADAASKDLLRRALEQT